MGNPQTYRPKADITLFDELLHIEDFLDWLCTVDHFLACMRIPEDQQVELVAFKLTWPASSWWDHLQLERSN